MRYWAFFSAKLAVAGGPLYGLLARLANLFPVKPKDAPDVWALEMSQQTLLCNLLLLGWFLLSAGALYVIVWDQRHRCRVCLRRLRMPVETGSWSRMLQFGRPRIEYICPYGHGILREEEVQISGLEAPKWDRTDDLWEDLCAASKDSVADARGRR
ncbi:MAG TPA: hypothetical protein VKV17_17395 [Bryobacteraceae bacterium]|nr:hypothetical protein [Bryobacteraceae bacterium]